MALLCLRVGADREERGRSNEGWKGINSKDRLKAGLYINKYIILYIVRAVRQEVRSF